MMKNNLKKATAFLTTALLVATGATAAMAAEADSASYSYLVGAQKNVSQSAVWAAAKELSGDEQREAYLAARGLGSSVYDQAEQLDAQALAAAGVISQETAQRIADFAAQKHATISRRYQDQSAQTPQERRAFYAGLTDEADGPGALLAAGIISAEEADALAAYQD